MQRGVALFVAASAVKALLIPAYFSTDFDVHRNWMAVTWSLPTSSWYFEATSVWTLDYPPLFAAFEWLLAAVASLCVEEDALRVSASPYFSWRLLLFQRLSVVVCDAVLVAGAVTALRCRSNAVSKADAAKADAVPWWCPLVIVLHPGLLIVDHVHFQYNGFLLGVLLLSLSALESVRRGPVTSANACCVCVSCLSRCSRRMPAACRGCPSRVQSWWMQGRTVVASVLFSALLCLKHTFVYIAPVFAVVVLRQPLREALLAAVAAVCSTSPAHPPTHTHTRAAVASALP
jgi:hypothetical protein